MEQTRENRQKNCEYSKKMIPDIIIFIKSLKIPLHQFILLIDVNELFVSKTGDITRLLRCTNIIDPIVMNHTFKNEPNTYKCGFNRIDFYFCTIGISSFIHKCGIFPFDFITTTDHHSIYLDIKIHAYLKDPPHPVIPSRDRLLQTTKPESTRVYKRHLTNYRTKQYWNKVKEIQDKIDNSSLKMLRN